MTTGEMVFGDQPLSPDDWPTEPEREYARLQEELGDQYDVDFESRVVETDAVGRIHYLDAGNPDGEPVLVLHGLSATAATWMPMLPSLTDEYRLLIPDRPGRGLSVAPSYENEYLRAFLTDYLVDFLDGFGIEQPHLVGNSLGGLQAFLLTLDHDRADRLCLVGGPGGLSTDIPFLYRLTTVKGISRLLNWLMSRQKPIETVKDQVDSIGVVDDSAIPELLYELWAASIVLPGRNKSLRTYSEKAGSWGKLHPIFDIADEVVEIENPTSFIWGTADQFFDPEPGQEVAERMPNAEFHLLDNYGHMPWLEPDSEVGGLVREFLNG